MGGWAAPWGIEYRIDTMNAYVALIVTGIASIVLPYAYRSAPLYLQKDRVSLFFSLMMLCLTGLLGMTVTGDAFNVFVFLEISSLSMYGLISLGQDRRALTAAFQYLVMGTIGGTFVLLGIGFLYVVTGTLNMADLAQRLPEVTQLRTLHTAFAFLVVGIGLKLAMFPLHLWLPNAYAYAPSAATVFIAATATKVAVYILLRFVFTVIGPDIAYGDLPFGEIAMGLAVLGLLSGSFVAIFQQNIKRMLAYSTISHVGFLILGLLAGTAEGYSAAMFYAITYALMAIGGFGMIILLSRAGIEADSLDDFKGLNERSPWFAFMMLVLMFSMAGVPPTVGFYAKLSVLQAVVGVDMVWLALVAVFFSVIGAFYYIRVVKLMYFDKPETEAPLQVNTDMQVAVSINGLAVLGLGLFPGSLLALCTSVLA